MEIKVGSKVKIGTNRQGYINWTGQVKEIIPTYKKDEKGNYFEAQDWGVYRVDIGSLIIDCHVGELWVLKEQG